MSKISIKNLIYVVDRKRILNGISLEIQAGEIVSIMGESGSGKTTLLKLMTGLRRPTSGEINIGDTDITPLSERELDKVRLDMGMVFQYAALFDSLSVYDNIVFSLVRHRKGITKQQLDNTVKTLLSQVDLDGVEKLYPSQLSGGMQKRVGLARALAMEPEMLFYDEPTSGLDPVTAQTIDTLILDTRSRTGVTSVVVSHQLQSIFSISDRIAMLYQGDIAVYGSPEEVLQSPHAGVQQFISSIRTNAKQL